MTEPKKGVKMQDHNPLGFPTCPQCGNMAVFVNEDGLCFECSADVLVHAAAKLVASQKKKSQNRIVCPHCDSDISEMDLEDVCAHKSACGEEMTLESMDRF